MTSAEQYTPREYSALDTVAAAKRTADQILRNNPLTNAVISHGLMRWTGNHVDINADKVDYVWIGDFLPADTSLGGIPQKGIVFRRDDSTAAGINDGFYSFAMYDHDPGGGGLGLRQTIHWRSLDGGNLWGESREGGQSWPEFPIPMGPYGTNTALWPGTGSGTFQVLWQGWGNIVGRDLVAEYSGQSETGAACEFQVKVFPNGGPSIDGPVRVVGVGATGHFKDTIDVTSVRGETRFIQLFGRVTNGVGRAAVTVTSFRSYRP